MAAASFAVSLAAADDRRGGTGRAAFEAGGTVRVSNPTLGRPVVEPHLAADPGNARRLLAAAMVVGDPHSPFDSSRLQVFFSDDGGDSWRETGLPWFGYDPWTLLLPGGGALVAWLGEPDPTSTSRPIRIFRFEHAGDRRPTEVETIAGEFDGGKMAVAPWDDARGADGGSAGLAGEDAGAPILAVTRFDHGSGGMRSQVAVYRLAAGARTGPSPPPALVDDGASTRLAAAPARLGTKRVVVAAMSRRSAGDGFEVWAHASDDGGRTFPSRALVSRRLSPGLGQAQLAGAGPVAGAVRGVVVFVRALGPPHAGGGIWLNRSTDGGRTWSDDRRVDGFADGLGIGAQTASAAFSPGGTLAITWLDGYGDPESGRHRLYFTWSDDQGETFAPPLDVSDLATDPLTYENGATGRLLPGGGHYLGLAALANDDFQALWSDSRDGAFALFTARLRRLDRRAAGTVHRE